MMNWFKSFILIFAAFKAIGQGDSIIRAPYLQQTGPGSTYINWITNNLCPSTVKYGAVKSNLNFSSVNNNPDTIHSCFLKHLSPNTTYYFTVSLNSTTQSSDTFFFYTAPPFGSTQKTRFLVLGDCGSGFVQQLNIKRAINYYRGNNYINGILLLGDNAYNSGMQTEYQSGFFTPYRNQFILSETCIYPAPGNHEYANSSTFAVNHNIPYYQVFDKVPMNAELGGVPSGHKEFYSFNYGNAHFISLDSYGMESGIYHLWDSLGPQYQWLEQDLKQDHSMWKIVYFHHPPFTMGSHNSDTETDLVNIRQKLCRLLEKYGVDMVMNGHSHNYERSWLQKGHYDLEASFNKALHTLDSSTAKYDGTLNSCPYKKDSADNKGTIYVVAGESGKIGGRQASYPHNSKCFSESAKGGALFLEIENNKLSAFYLMEDSLIHDDFVIFKNVNRHQILNISASQTFTLSASWNGTYFWPNNNSSIKYQVVNDTSNAQYIVRDSLNCLADTFNIIATSIPEKFNNSDFRVYPNPAKDKLFFELKHIYSEAEASILTNEGKLVFVTKLSFVNGKADLNLTNINLAPASYQISLKFSEKTITTQVFISR